MYVCGRFTIQYLISVREVALAYILVSTGPFQRGFQWQVFKRFVNCVEGGYAYHSEVLSHACMV